MDVDHAVLRPAGGAIVLAALVLPAVPGHPGVPCPLRTMTGIPCPLCGMTTGVEAAVHGHLLTSLAANPFAVPLVAMIALLLVRPSLAPRRIPAWLAGAAVAAAWTFELARFHVL